MRCYNNVIALVTLVTIATYCVTGNGTVELMQEYNIYAQSLDIDNPFHMYSVWYDTLPNVSYCRLEISKEIM